MQFLFHMAFLLVVFSGGSIFIFKYFQADIEDSIFISTVGIIAIIYLFCLLNYPVLGVTVVCILSVVLFALSLIKSATISKKIKTQSFTLLLKSPSIILYVLAFVFIYITMYKRVFYNWDEFSHWGKAVKQMFYYSESIASRALNLQYPSYPPAIQLYSLLFVKNNNEFVEGLLYSANNIFCVTLFIPFIKKFRSVLGFFLSLILLYIFFKIPVIFTGDVFPVSILMDPILGLVFGTFLATLYTEQRSVTLLRIKVCAFLFVLPLVKETGIIFAFIGLVMYIILYELKFAKKDINVKWIAANIFSLLFAKVSWVIHTKIFDATMKFSDRMPSLDVILNVLKGHAEEGKNYQAGVMKNILNTMFYSTTHSNFDIKITYFQWFLIFTVSFSLLSYFIYISIKKAQNYSEKHIYFVHFNNFVWSHISAFIFLFLGLIGYIGALYFTYTFLMDEWEALALASFTRYIGSFFIGLFTLVFFMMCDWLISKSKYIQQIFYIFSICSILMFFYPPDINMYSGWKERAAERNAMYNTAVSKLEPLDTKNGYIFVVTDQGFNISALAYLLSQKNNDFGWSGQIMEYLESDFFNWLMSNGRYKYLYLFNPVPEFYDAYGFMFDSLNRETNEGLYEIINENGIIKFKAMD